VVVWDGVGSEVVAICPIVDFLSPSSLPSFGTCTDDLEIQRLADDPGVDFLQLLCTQLMQSANDSHNRNPQCYYGSPVAELKVDSWIRKHGSKDNVVAFWRRTEPPT